jgi:hypothetical protein
METFLPLFLGLMWACSLVLSYGVGWLRGYDVADDNHRWSRWLIKREQNRSVRF